MIHNPCGADLPAYDIGGVVVHLAGCPHTGAELGAWARAIVSAVSDAADIETPPVSPETPRDTAVARTVSTAPDIEELTVLRDGGMSYRDLANLAGVAPETVRRRIKRHRDGQGGHVVTNRLFTSPRCDRCGGQALLGALCAACKRELGDAIVAALNEGEENDRDR